MQYATEKQIKALIGENAPAVARRELLAVLDVIARELVHKRAAGLSTGEYAYYPTSKLLNRWWSSDDVGGIPMSATLLGIMVDQLGLTSDDFDVYPDEVVGRPWFVRKIKTQAELEGGRLAGESMNIEKVIDKMLGEGSALRDVEPAVRQNAANNAARRKRKAAVPTLTPQDLIDMLNEQLADIGAGGTDALEKISQAIGYESADEFMSTDSLVIDSVIAAIAKRLPKNEEWRAALYDHLGL